MPRSVWFSGFSFGVAFVYLPWWGKTMYVVFMIGMVLCWTAADAMQIHRKLRVYLVRASTKNCFASLPWLVCRLTLKLSRRRSPIPILPGGS